MDKKNINYSSKFFGDAVILALVTGLGYLATNRAESAYIGYYGITSNSSLVSPPVTETIWVTFYVVVFAIGFLMLSKPMHKLIAPKKENKKNILWQGWSVLLAYYASFVLIRVLLLNEVSMSFIIECIATLLGLLLYSWLIYYFVRKGTFSKTGKRISDQLFLNTHIHTFIEKANIKIWIFVPILILATLTLAPDFGTAIARRKVTYDIINARPPLVVLAQYQDILIAAPFVQNNKQVINQIHLININTLEERGLYLSQEKIGPLRPSIQTKSFWDKIADHLWDYGTSEL